MIRAVIISATLAALFCMYLDRPSPIIHPPKIDYCLVGATGNFLPCSGLKYKLAI